MVTWDLCSLGFKNKPDSFQLVIQWDGTCSCVHLWSMAGKEFEPLTGAGTCSLCIRVLSRNSGARAGVLGPRRAEMSREELWVPEQLLPGRTANLCENQSMCAGGEGNTQYHLLPCVTVPRGSSGIWAAYTNFFIKQIVRVSFSAVCSSSPGSVLIWRY